MKIPEHAAQGAYAPSLPVCERCGDPIRDDPYEPSEPFEDCGILCKDCGMCWEQEQEENRIAAQIDDAYEAHRDELYDEWYLEQYLKDRDAARS